MNPVPGTSRCRRRASSGRESDLTTVSELLASQRLVTLTGVGGVGKTRLALQVATDLLPQFGDGVWFVELAEVGDPRAVPSAVAAPLGIVPQAEQSITDTVADSLAGRRALLVLDNCEHVLDAAADLVEALLGRSTEVKILATSRESLRVPGEHVWSVPSLDVRAGSDSNAVTLFEERARAVNASFSLADDPAAVIAICEQLDGIALAIELAAARMVSMTPADLRDRLDDRFRILGGGRRGLERHQTLRQAVQWSYELLDADEQRVLDHCSTFAGGFDIGAAEAICATGDLDEFSLFDVLDSLVRKSMLVAERHANHVRYRMLETIRQFAQDRLVAVGSVESAHDRHALHYANGANNVMIRWASPEQPEAYRWFGTELANLRASFRWSSDHGDIDTAATIAGKTAFIGTYFQSFEPFSWCKELLEHPLVGGHRLQKWLYLGAAQGAFLGNAEEAIRYGEAGLALEPADHEPVTHELEKTAIGVAHLFAGRPDKWLTIAQEVSDSPKDDLALGPVSVVWVLATLGEYERATAIADEMLEGAKSTGVPWSIAYALSAYGKAFTNLDPERALTAHREAVAVARESNNRMFEMVFSRELAGLEAIAGDPDAALDTFEEIIQAFHQTGDVGNLSPTLGYLAVFLERIEQLDDAATTFGAASRHASALAMVTELGVVADRLGDQLGSAFEPFVARGRAMNTGEAVRHAQNAITRARNEIG